MTICKCGKPGTYTDPFTPHPKNFCDTCYSTHLEKKIVNAFPRVIRGYPLAIAVSGGKDSTTLLEVVMKYQKELKIPKITTIYLEEEIPEIQEERQMIIKNLERKYSDLKVHYESYSELYGLSLPEMIEKSNVMDLRFTPCTVCGILKKQAIFKISREQEIPYIALGTTLEDVASTILLNIIRGRPQSSLDNTGVPPQEPGNPQILKPLSRISEDLILKYIGINNIPVITSQCKYADRSIRSDLAILMTNLKKRDPMGSLLFNITKANIVSNPPKNNETYCTQCGSPSVQSLCSACRILAKLR